MIATFAIFFGLLQIHAFGFIPQSKMKTSKHHSYTSHHQIVYKKRIRISNIRLASISNSDDYNDDTSSASSLDMSSLRKRIQKQDTQYTNLLLEQSKYRILPTDEDQRIIPDSVHIILFHPGTPKQHVHTIEYPVGSGENMILAFESQTNSIRFARMLQQDLDFAEPSPEETMFEPFRQYCEMSGLSLMIVPKGFELSPPQINANDMSEDTIEDIDDKEDDIEDAKDDRISKNISYRGDDDLDAWG